MSPYDLFYEATVYDKGYKDSLEGGGQGLELENAGL